MSAHLSIQTAIVAALNAAPALAGGNVKANTTRPVAGSASSAVVVRMLQSRAATPQMISGPYDWSTVYQVECLGRAATGSADPVAAVDALLSAAWERLASVNLASLGVLDVRMSPQIDWQYDDGETPTISAAINLQVVHRTTSTNLNPWT